MSQRRYNDVLLRTQFVLFSGQTVWDSTRELFGIKVTEGYAT